MNKFDFGHYQRLLLRIHFVLSGACLVLFSASLLSAPQLSPPLVSTGLVVSDSADRKLAKHGLVKLGDALFSVLFFDIYHGHLYSQSGKYPLKNSQDKLVFEIEYFKNISAEALIEHTVEQWQHLNYAESQYGHYLPKLKKLWPNIVAGDQLALEFVGGQSHFYFNGRYIGSINDNIFGQLFVDIWLSANTSQPKLREKLLANLPNRH